MFIGLTPTKIFIACDYVKLSNPQLVRYYSKNLDPEIETLELATVFPLHLISMRVYCKGRRQIMKIQLCTKQILLFEFGGLLMRNVYFRFLFIIHSIVNIIFKFKISVFIKTNWNIWKDMIDHLRKHNNQLPCAVYLSQSSSNETFNDYKYRKKDLQQHSTSISTNGLFNEYLNQDPNDGVCSDSSNLCKKTNHLSRDSKSSLFRKISNLFSKQSVYSLPETPSITGDEKCKEYLKQIDNVSLYGAVDLEKW